MRKIFRHIISGLFIASIFSATLIVMYFTFPHLQAQVDKLRGSISPDHEYVKKHVSLGKEVVTVYVSDTEDKRVLGLSGRERLAKNFGMLFVFETMGHHGIWMKDMYIPLDIIWINDRSKIVHIEQNVTPESYPTIYYPGDESLYVLEVNAGFVQTGQIKEGDLVTIY